MTQQITTPKLNLYQKLAAIASEIGALEKTGVYKTNSASYNFLKHSVIVGTLRPLLEKYGVTVDFEIIDCQYLDNNLTLLRMNYTVTDADEPAVHFTRAWVSEAKDGSDKGRGDKAINKALTASEKNIFRTLFHISDYDPEEDGNEAQPAPLAPRPATTPTNNGIKPPTKPLTVVGGNNLTVVPAQKIPLPKLMELYEGKLRAAVDLKSLSVVGNEISLDIPEGPELDVLRGLYSDRLKALKG